MSSCAPCKSANNLTLDAFFQQIYLPQAKLRKRSWALDERLSRNHLSKPFGAKYLRSISQWEIESWLNNLLTTGISPATCNRILALLKTVCSLAEKRGIIGMGLSPCKAIHPFKVSNQRERYLTLTEAKQLMAFLQSSHAQAAKVIQLLLLTGARKSEILKARWENVHMEQKLLTVPIAKSGKSRHIILSQMALSIIKDLPRVEGSAWLFPSQVSSKPLVDIYSFWDKLRNQLGLYDVRIHDLRHTFASFLVNTGHSLYEVQKLLGHSNPHTTMRYAHLEHASLLAAAESVSGFLR